MKYAFSLFVTLWITALSVAPNANAQLKSILQLEGETLELSFTGLLPNHIYRLEALRGHDWQDGQIWVYRSLTRFKTDAAGSAKISEEKAKKVLWSMKEVKRDSLDPKAIQPTEYRDLKLSVIDATTEQRVQNLSYDRPFASPSVAQIETDINKDGFRGTLFLPSGCSAQSKCPILIFWGGSGGGQPREIAGYLASRGLAVLTVEYFTFKRDLVNPNLPYSIKEVPVDQIIGNAIKYAKKHPALDSQRIAAGGSSRGGELALEVGVRFGHELKGLLAIRPSMYRYGTRVTGREVLWIDEAGVAHRPEEFSGWMWNGQPLPFLPYGNVLQEELAVQLGAITVSHGNPMSLFLRPGFEYIQSHASAAALAAARIQVERIPFPIYVSASPGDGMWDANTQLSLIHEKRKQAGRDSKDVYVLLPGGHYSAVPGTPTSDLNYMSLPGQYNDKTNPKTGEREEWGETIFMDAQKGVTARDMNSQNEIQMQSMVDYLSKRLNWNPSKGCELVLQ